MAQSLQTTYRAALLGMVAAPAPEMDLPWLPPLGRMADHLSRFPPEPLPAALVAEGQSLMASAPVDGLLALVPWQLVQITAQPAPVLPWQGWPHQNALETLFWGLCQGMLGGRDRLLRMTVPCPWSPDPAEEAIALAHQALVLAQGDYTLAVQLCHTPGPLALAGLLGGACGSPIPLPWQARARGRVADPTDQGRDVTAMATPPFHRWGDGLLRHWAGAMEVQPWLSR